MKRLISVLILLLTLCSCAGKIGQESLPSAQPKYVFLFIGDGMAMPQVNAAEAYLGDVLTEEIDVKRLSFTQFPVMGLMTTFSSDSSITDSASAATAMASGAKADSKVLNITPEGTLLTPFTYNFKQKGYRVGIVSSMPINHATPAGFYANAPSRHGGYEIGGQIHKSGFDYFGGGGLMNRFGAENDQEDLYILLRNNGYTVAETKADILALTGGNKAVAVNEILHYTYEMPFEIDRADDDLSLADHSRKAIEMLDNDMGFFLMVEGGKIDLACHSNDAATAIKDVLAFDKAVLEAIAFYHRHPNETLIIVTADHETGGLTIGNGATGYMTYLEKLYAQKGSYMTFNNEVMKPYKEGNSVKESIFELDAEIKNFFGFELGELGAEEMLELEKAYKSSIEGDRIGRRLYRGEPLTMALLQIVSKKAGLGWTTRGHTALAVPIFAMGVQAASFSGYYDNTDIHHKIMALIGQ